MHAHGRVHCCHNNDTRNCSTNRTWSAISQSAIHTMQGAGVGVGGLSSLPLQVVIYFSGWYLVLFYPALLAALIYKGDQNALFGTVTLLAIYTASMI